MRRLLVVFAAAVLLFGAQLVTPAEAQGGWTCNWSFASSGLPSGWTINTGSLTGSGIQSATVDYVYKARVSWPSGTTITSVTVTYTKSATYTSIWYGSGDLQPHTGNFGNTATSATRSGTGSANGGYWQVEGTTETLLFISGFEAEGTGTNPCPATPTPTGPASTNTPIPPTGAPAAGTPWIVNTFLTPTPIAVDASGLYEALQQGNDSILSLPPDLSSAGLPIESGSRVFGYVKWLVSPSSADEIAGPFAPIVSHTGIFLTITFFTALVYAVVWVTVFLFKFVIWIFKFIVLIVDLVLQFAQAVGAFIGGIVKLILGG